MNKKNKPLVEMSAAHDAALAAEIRRLRERAGMTWQKLADACGVDVVTVQRWGSGARRPDAKTLAALDRIFDR